MEEIKDKMNSALHTKKQLKRWLLVSPQTYESWQTLFEAANNIRNHNMIRKCWSIFTMKIDLETVIKRKDNESNDFGCLPKRLCRRSSASRVYNSICIFSNKEKLSKDSISREKFTQAIRVRADQTVRECAIQKRDEKILVVTSTDVIAAEAYYHLSCYKNYTRIIQESKQNKERQHDNERCDGDDSYQMVERETYAGLFEYIRTNTIPNRVCANHFIDCKTGILQ